MALSITTTADATILKNAFLATDSGITVTSTPVYTGAAVAAGTLAADITLTASSGLFSELTIPKGIALSTGSLVDVPTTNENSDYTTDNGMPGDSDLLTAAQAGLGNNAESTHDAAILEFDFTIDDSSKTGVAFDVLYASDEYPEFADSFVDIASVLIDGINYALFNNIAARPLSVLQANIDEGYFINNEGSFDSRTGAVIPAPLQIEYDGISHALRIVATSLSAGSHHIKIGIADTNDEILDSTVFLANFQATSATSGSNIVSEFDPNNISNKKVSDFIGNTGKSNKYFDDIEETAGQITAILSQLGIAAAEFNQLINLLDQANFWEDKEGRNDTLNLFGGDDTASLGMGNDKADGGVGDDGIDGEEGNDILNGGTGNDTLDGGAGNDKMTGGEGDDTYHVDSKKDSLTEKTNAGTDTVVSHIDYTLGKEIENLEFISGMDNLSGTGNKGSNKITGNEGDNTLNGKEGNDTLTGGAGDDIFKFDTKLNATANVDIISDFVSGADVIYLSKKILSKYKAGDVLSTDFVAGAGATAQDETDHFLYDTTTGVLSYDADGDGPKLAVQFATLTGAPDLVASDLHVF